MKTMELQGDLLNLFVAKAMGGVIDADLRAPFDEWGCGVIYKGGIFSPEKDVSSIWAQVMKLRISTTDVGDGRWLITMPAPTDHNSVPFPPTYCDNPLAGYCYAIVWGAFGPTVSDTLETTLFGTVNLGLFNLAF